VADARSNSRPMFWRIVRRLIAANRGRLIVILLALGAGAAVTAALLNLQVDAKSRLSGEFRSFGANVVIAPRSSLDPSNATLDESVLRQIPSEWMGERVEARSVLYVVAVSFNQVLPPTSVMVSGVSGAGVPDLIAKGPITPYKDGMYTHVPICLLGARAFKRVRPNGYEAMHEGPSIRLGGGVPHQTEECSSTNLPPTGGPEDDQLMMALPVAQRLSGMPGKISLVELTVPGKPASINDFVASLQQKFPDADVHGIRQFTEAEGKIYDRISGLLTATVAVVLVLTTLCVMAAMTNVAMERKNDVGLMKAIGGATRRVLRLFLAEAATLGLIAGLIGAAVGLALSVALGKAVFGVAAQPRFIVYPVVVALTIVVAVAGAYPLRRLAGIRPASVFRGEA
jgi:putative ABC transport system permease protein